MLYKRNPQLNSNGELQHLLSIEGLPKAILTQILDTAASFASVNNREVKKVPLLRGKSVFNLFFENSTRTRLSFELAEKRLSADVLNFSASSSSVSKGETLIDTVNNILAMKVDMVVMRHSSPGAAHFLSQNVSASIVNAGDGAHEHPTQALLDSFTIREKLGDVGGKKIVIVGDILHSRVALSNIYALQMQGAEVKVCGPKTFNLLLKLSFNRYGDCFVQVGELKIREIFQEFFIGERRMVLRTARAFFGDRGTFSLQSAQNPG